MLNYKEIGLRIRKIRRDRNLSQEQLAEKVNISTTHMSHIETGNTKLSLLVLTDLAQALDVPTDSLLFGQKIPDRENDVENIQTLLNTCTSKQVHAIFRIISSIKQTLDEYE